MSNLKIDKTKNLQMRKEEKYVINIISIIR